jgi:membrane protein implicated in regulation of membrane protease activity
MDFIERLFGLSPDGGSGWFEFLLFAIPLAGIAWLWRRRVKRQRRDDSDRRHRR